MSWVAVAVAGGSIAGGYLAGEAQKGAAKEASGAQTRASESALEEQRRQFDLIQKLLSPYVQAGETALTQQQALAGLGGTEAQQNVINMIQESPQFKALTQTGEEAILQQASATGGLRGGNVQRALAQYRPQVLSDLINQQYGRLSGLSQLGQASAAGVGNAGQAAGANIGNLYGQIGSAQAGAALAGGQASAQQWGGLVSGLGILAGGVPSQTGGLTYKGGLF